jgi:Pterin 4 alpha carbinolamine dehydratase
MSEKDNVQIESPMSKVRPPRRIFTRLKPERVEELLRSMPGWRLLPGGKFIGRVRQFASERMAADYAAFVSAYAVDAGLPVNLNLSGQTVVLTLFTPSRNGRAIALTEEVLGFAKSLG